MHWPHPAFASAAPLQPGPTRRRRPRIRRIQQTDWKMSVDGSASRKHDLGVGHAPWHRRAAFGAPCLHRTTPRRPGRQVSSWRYREGSKGPNRPRRSPPPQRLLRLELVSTARTRCTVRRRVRQHDYAWRLREGAGGDSGISTRRHSRGAAAQPTMTALQGLTSPCTAASCACGGGTPRVRRREKFLGS